MSIQLYSQRVDCLDGSYLDELVMHVATSEVGQVRITDARVALEQEYVSGSDQIELSRRYLQLLQFIQLLLVEEHHLPWRTLQGWLVCLKLVVVVIVLAVSPADDHLQHDDVLADGSVHILLLLAQVVHEALESVFVKIVECHLEVGKTMLPSPVAERFQIVADGLILLTGLDSPVVELAGIGLIFMIYIPECQSSVNFALFLGW